MSGADKLIVLSGGPETGSELSITSFHFLLIVAQFKNGPTPIDPGINSGKHIVSRPARTFEMDLQMLVLAY